MADEIKWMKEHHIKSRPVCIECGNSVKFIGRPSWDKIGKTVNGYLRFCCKSCAQKNKLTREKKRQTSLSHYNTDFPMQNNEVKEKYKGTCELKYGNEIVNPFQSEEVKAKIKETNNKNLNADYPSQNKTVKEKQVKEWKKKTADIMAKVIMTKKKKYGISCQSDKMRKTYKEKLNANYPLCNANIRKKTYENKIRNGNEHRSKPEDLLYKLLCEIYPDIMHNYKSSEYPYCCDFYLPNYKLYIEYQGYWTHSDHLFNKNSIKDQVEKERITQKALNGHKEYLNKLNIWCVKDIDKFNKAKENKLNFLSLYKVSNEFNKLCYRKYGIKFKDKVKEQLFNLIEEFKGKENFQKIITENL